MRSAPVIDRADSIFYALFMRPLMVILCFHFLWLPYVTAYEGTSAPGILDDRSFAGTIRSEEFKDAGNQPAIAITISGKDSCIESAWLKERGFSGVPCKAGGISGIGDRSFVSLPAEGKNDAGEEVRLNIEVTDFKELKATVVITYADKKTKTWKVEAKIDGSGKK